MPTESDATAMDDGVEEEVEELQPVYSGFIIVCLPESGSDDEDMPASGSLIEEADRRGITSLVELLSEYGVDGYRLIQSLTPEQVREVENPSDDDGYDLSSEEWGILEENEPPSLNLFWRVDVREQPLEITPELVEKLQGLANDGIVHLAYPEEQVMLAQTEPTDEARYDEQGYLHDGPIGIGVEAAWRKFADGRALNNVTLVDIEMGWGLHDDLPDWLPDVPIWGYPAEGAGYHGTAVLGIIMATHNSEGIIGQAAQLAPDRLLLSSTIKETAEKAHDNNVADAIYAVLHEGGLQAGDVLLIEVERSHHPVESDRADLKAILSAFKRGIIVVEAAGNGGEDLDNLIHFESGAILVGACNSEMSDDGAGHTRLPKSNYGSRVNCHAWGSDVLTTDINGGYSDFSDTSAAAAIIAGAVLLIQSISKTAGTTIRPLEMRAILSNTGTPQIPTQAENVNGNKPIGVMPDMYMILDSLGLLE